MRVTQADHLTFSSLEEYNRFLENPEAASSKIAGSSYPSLRAEIDKLMEQVEQDSARETSIPGIEDTIYADYGPLLDVLNRDKVVELYGNLVRVDLLRQRVYAISVSVPDADVLIFGDEGSNPALKTYSTDDEVALILAGQQRSLFRGCDDPNPSSDKAISHDDMCDDRHRTKKEVTYQKAGVYFSLVAEAKGQVRRLRVWWADNDRWPDMDVNMAYKQRCGETFARFIGHPSTHTHAALNWTRNGHKATFRPYSSTTALAWYDFGANISGCGVRWLRING